MAAASSSFGGAAIQRVPGGGGVLSPGDMPAGASSAEFIVLVAGVALVIVAVLFIALMQRGRKRRGSSACSGTSFRE